MDLTLSLWYLQVLQVEYHTLHLCKGVDISTSVHTLLIDLKNTFSNIVNFYSSAGIFTFINQGIKLDIF